MSCPPTQGRRFAGRYPNRGATVSNPTKSMRAAEGIHRIEGRPQPPPTLRASGTVCAKTDTQSGSGTLAQRRASTTNPRVGLKPTSPLNAAGTRPDPAVSVPSAKGDDGPLYRHGRATAAATGDVRRVDSVRHGAVGRSGTGQPGGELVQVGLADGYGSGGEEAFDYRRGVLRDVCVFRAACRGRCVRQIHVGP